MNKYILIIIMSLGIQSIMFHAAEESKESDNSINITETVNNKVYQPLKDGFNLLRENDGNIPTFHEFIQQNLTPSELETNFGDLISNAETIISESIKEQFYTILNDEIEKIKNNENNQRSQNLTANSFLQTDSTYSTVPRLQLEQSIKIPNRKPAINHTINGLDFYEIQDPVFQYIMQHKNGFLKPIMQEWIESDPIKYIHMMEQSIRYNHQLLAAFLLNMGVNPNFGMKSSDTHSMQPLNQYLLAHAVYYQRTYIVNLLLEHKANINIKWYDYSDSYNHQTLLTEAANYDDIATIQSLIAYSADFNQKNEEEKTPLIIAVKRNNFELVKILLDAYANPNIPDTIQDYRTTGDTNAHTKALKNSYNSTFANSLVNFNIDTHQRDIYGNTPLMLAAHHNFAEIANMLIQAGADINIANIFCGTALQIAQRNNYTEIANMLLNAGAHQYTPADRDEYPNLEPSHELTLSHKPLPAPSDFITGKIPTFLHREYNNSPSFKESFFGSLSDLHEIDPLSEIFSIENLSLQSQNEDERTTPPFLNLDIQMAPRIKNRKNIPYKSTRSSKINNKKSK